MKHYEKLKTLAVLFFSFFKIGAVTFGGGMSMLPILRQDLVDKKKWARDEEMIDYFAIGQSTPGVIAVNVATFIGYKQAGVIGAVVGVTGIVFPSLIIIILIAAFLSNFSEIMWIRRALKGINAAVAVLLVRAVFSFGKKTVFDIFTFLIAAAAFVSMLVFKVQGVWIVAGSAFAGWLCRTLKDALRKKSV